jgi:threonylcarbamoyladenosine tRNA methylthiotransferase MtaB
VKYSVITFGCRVNQADSLAIEAGLRARGGVGAPPDCADLVVVNTCSVTAAADQSARQTIRRIARANPAARVVVTGCYATRRPDEICALPNVVCVVSNHDKERLAAILDRRIGRGGGTPGWFGDGDGPCGAPLGPGAVGRTVFTLRVQTGCDEACSYCIIPHTRGPGRSKPLDQVVRDVERAVEAGYKEIVITGVHLGSYGRDLGDGTTLSQLVRRLMEWEGDVLFRLSSLEPMDCTPAVVDMVAASPRLAPHFHLPLQHGSDEILRRMRRPYSAAQYAALVGRIRSLISHASIGSDIIVGFPGETEMHFAVLCSLLRDLPLTYLHVFPYSDRPGTEATAMSGKVDGAAIRERGREVRAIGETLARRFRETQVGSVRRALTVDDGAAAVTDNYLRVHLDRRCGRNEWVTVRLTGDREAAVECGERP